MIFILLLSLIIQFIVSYRILSKSDIFYILSLQPIILLLNAGIVSILDSFVYLNFQNKVYELLLVALCELVLAFAFKIEIKLKREIIVSKKDFFSLIVISISLFFLFYLFLSSANLYLTSGDGIAHLSILNDIKMYKQELLHYVYFDKDRNILAIGNFYPRASHYLGNIINVRNFSNEIVYYNLMNLSFSLFWPAALYHLVRIYTNSKFSITILLFLLTLNIFPLGLIYTANLSSIYGTIAAVGGFAVLGNLNFRVLSSRFIAYFTFLILIALYHPSGIFTFLALILLNYFILNKHKIFNFRFFYKSTISFILLVFFVLQYFNNELDTYLSSSRPRILNTNGVIQLLSNFSIIEPYLVKYYNLAFSTTLLMVPNFLLILTLIYFQKFKRNFLAISLCLYMLIVTSTFFAGFEPPLSYLSFLGIMFYQSPIRIAHLGILVYAFVVINFIISKKNLELLSQSKFLLIQYSIYIYFLSWTWFTLASSF